MTSKTRDFSHFIYPLNPKSGFAFRDGLDPSRNSVDDFIATMDYSETYRWRLASGYRLVQPFDMVWAYFAAPSRCIVAAGHIQDYPEWKADWGRYSIPIRWDRDLTERLIGAPIPFAAFQQRVQGAVQTATDRTSRVLDSWLRRNASKGWKEREESVRYTRRLMQQRLGQQTFRSNLMNAYGGTCAVTGCNVDRTLQAAHILPVADGGNHATSNGLLLRADIHNLFDLGYITINRNGIIETSKELAGSDYERFNGQPLRQPRQVSHRPARRALAQHRERWKATT